MSIVSMLNASGWEAFTLPHGAKYPPPKGWTGTSESPSEGMLYEEIDKELEGSVNIAVRLPEGVVGVDIDEVDSPAQKKILSASCASWRVSSKDGRDRFTAFFALPEGVDAGQLKNIDGIDLITRTHRYSIIHGVHPSGRDYKLFSPAGIEVSLELLPDPDDLPLLPQEVFELMKRGEEKPEKQSPMESFETPSQTVFEGTPCAVVQKAYFKGREMMLSEGRAKGLMKAAFALSALGANGHSLGRIPAILLEDFIHIAGEERRKEGERLISIIKGVDGVCSCESSSNNGSFYVSKDLLRGAGMEAGEVEAEVFLKEKSVKEGEIKNPKAWRERTAANLLKDKIAKETNRARAEKLYSADRIRNEEKDILKLRLLVDSLAADDFEKQVLFLIGVGFSSKEIAEELDSSRSKIERAKRKIRERNHG